uniref:SPARK domain-containing protein n=1 Tax=Heterorhabditis bacteriophora TaxID=37862 RepID=A0A1I7X496_HETBA
MPKQRLGGLPYLKTSLKFNWNSSENVDSNELSSIMLKLFDFLKLNGFSVPKNDCLSPSNDVLCVDDFSNSQASIGLQSTLDAMFDSSACCVFFDADSIRPSAVASALGLYSINCSETTSVYCIPGLIHQISLSLNRKSEAIALKQCPHDLLAELKSSLSPVGIMQSKKLFLICVLSLVVVLSDFAAVKSATIQLVDGIHAALSSIKAHKFKKMYVYIAKLVV